MAKKDKKKKEDKGGDDPIAAARAAIERAFSASAEGAQSTRERTREIVDEIAAAAGRVRHTLEDMRVLDEVKRLRTEVNALATRVAKLEIKPAAKAPAASGSSSTAKRPAAAKSAAKRKPAAKRTAAKRKPAAKRTAAKRKPAAARRKPAAAKRKPAAPKPPAS